MTKVRRASGVDLADVRRAAQAATAERASAAAERVRQRSVTPPPARGARRASGAGIDTVPRMRASVKASTPLGSADPVTAAGAKSTTVAPPRAQYEFDAFDVAALVYFALHIPTTLLIDAQTVLPAAVIPRPLADVLAWHVRVNRDPFVGVGARPPWFVGIVWAELLLQVPFFVFAIAAWLRRDGAVRVPTIIYGAHTATTLVPILAELVLGGRLSTAERATLVAIYAPYLVMPLLLLWRAASRSVMFPTPQPAKRA